MLIQTKLHLYYNTHYNKHFGVQITELGSMFALDVHQLKHS